MYDSSSIQLHSYLNFSASFALNLIISSTKKSTKYNKICINFTVLSKSF